MPGLSGASGAAEPNPSPDAGSAPGGAVVTGAPDVPRQVLTELTQGWDPTVIVPRDISGSIPPVQHQASVLCAVLIVLINLLTCDQGNITWNIHPLNT